MGFLPIVSAEEISTKDFGAGKDLLNGKNV